MKKIKYVLFALIVINIAFIWGNSILSNYQSNYLSDKVVEIIDPSQTSSAINSDTSSNQSEQQPPAQPQVEDSVLIGIVRKFAHVGEFMSLGILTSLIILMDKFSLIRFQHLALAGILVPLIDETIQLIGDARGPLVSDIWIDIGGFAVGSALTVLILILVKKRRNTHGN